MIIFDIIKKELASKVCIYAFAILNGISTLIFAYALSNVITDLFYKESQAAASYFLMLPLAMLLKNFSEYKLNIFIINLCENVSINLRKKLHTAFLSTKRNTENIDIIAIENVETILDAIETILPLFLNIIFNLPIFLFAVLFLDLNSFLLMLVSLPIAPILLYLIGNIIKQKTESKWHELINLHKKFKEILSAIIMIKIFRAEAIHKTRIKNLSSEFASCSIDVLKVAFISSFAIELTTTLSIAIIAVTLGFRLIKDDISFDLAFFILLILPYFYGNLRQCSTAFHAFINAKTAWEKISLYLQIDNFKNINRKTEKIIHPPSLTVKNLNFSYNKSDKPTLSDISFYLPENSFTLLLGESGSGKSTLLNLITNYENDFNGEILIENYPIKNIAPENFSKHIAYASQSPHIFQASLRENISLFDDIDDEKIIYAIKLAALDNFLKNLPEGINTIIGKKGIMPSSGEIRRIGLARVILLNSPLILLDEVTAGLDEATEKQILDNLEEFARRKTVLFATHREQVIKRFKNHIILDGGRLIE